MEIESLNKLKKDTSTTSTELYDLFSVNFVFKPNIELIEYTVTKEDEMRLDLVFLNMYQLDLNSLDQYTQDIDVISYINNIDNPLNIKEGMVFQYPYNISDLSEFRYEPAVSEKSNDVSKQLAVPNLPNKSTRTDDSRKTYLDNDYSLPPVVLETPKEPVTIVDGFFTIGGI
jgi:hypothetical protein